MRCACAPPGTAAALRPRSAISWNGAWSRLGRKVGLTDEDIVAIDQTRDKSPAEPMKFE